MQRSSDEEGLGSGPREAFISFPTQGPHVVEMAFEFGLVSL